MDYNYNEGNLLKEIEKYIDSTYSQHYAGNGKTQSMDLISASGKGMDFCLGNIIKYSSRFGKKDGENRKDIIKIVHYGILALNEYDIGVKQSEID
jgi:hypothetical protein